MCSWTDFSWSTCFVKLLVRTVPVYSWKYIFSISGYSRMINKQRIERTQNSMLENKCPLKVFLQLFCRRGTIWMKLCNRIFPQHFLQWDTLQIDDKVWSCPSLLLMACNLLIEVLECYWTWMKNIQNRHILSH